MSAEERTLEVEAESSTETDADLNFEGETRYLSDSTWGIARALDDEEIDSALRDCRDYLQAWIEEAEGDYELKPEWVVEDVRGKSLRGIEILSSDGSEIGRLGGKIFSSVGLLMMTMKQVGEFGPYLEIDIDPEKGSIGQEDYQDLITHLNTWQDFHHYEAPKMRFTGIPHDY